MRSSCRRINAEKRHCHITSILPISQLDEFGNRTVVAFRLYLETAAFLAFTHLNTHDGSVLPELPGRLNGCDIEFTYELRDSRFQEAYATKEFLKAVSSSDPSRFPFALLGSARSAVSQVLAILTGTFQIPQISPTSSAPTLNDKYTYPYFTRTQTSTDTDARACANYLFSLGVTHVGVLHRQDLFANSYAFELAEEARRLGITAVTWGFREDSIERAVRELKNLDYRYIVGIFTQEIWRQVISAAFKAEIIGVPTHSWIFSSANVNFVDPRFTLEDTDLAKAIHGSGVLVPNRLPSELLDTALSHFAQNKTMQDEFKALHAEPALLESFEFTDLPPGSSVFFYQLAYDAMIALGLAACNSHSDLFTSSEFLATLKGTEFNGVSGEVKFDPATGSRSAEGLSFRIENVVLANFDNSTYRFTSKTAVEIKIPEAKSIRPFVYQDNTTIPPIALPPVEEQMNLIGPAVLGVGLTLGTLAILASIGLVIWTYVHQESPAVKSSQPIFLYQICVGTLIMGSAVIPLAAQEPLSQSMLNAACMLTPWLVSTGWVIAFSALFTKTWRLNKLFRSSERFRRITIKPQDVLGPFFGFMIFNVAFLIGWTVAAPLRWERRQRTNFDQFGRKTDSWGTCYSSESNVSPLIFVIPLISVNVLSLIITCYQSYLSRTLPTEYSESLFLMVSMASTLETILLASPLLFLVHESPGPKFVVQSIYIFVLCMALLLPIFIPKELRRKHHISLKLLRSGQCFPSSENSRLMRGAEALTQPGGRMESMNLFSISKKVYTRLASGQCDSIRNVFEEVKEDSGSVEKGSMRISRNLEYCAQHSRGRMTCARKDKKKRKPAAQNDAKEEELSSEDDEETMTNDAFR